MRGLMQDWPLLVGKILDHAAETYPRQEIVTMAVEGGIHRYTYTDLHLRTRKLCQALLKIGVKEGDNVGTLAWNTYRHMEAWYGAAGMGGVYHTLNPRLFPEQLTYIINHAEDKVLLLDLTFVPIVENLIDSLGSIEHFIIMTDREHMPETNLRNVLCYEDLLAAEDGNYEWADVDENAACGMCYTSGTTGNPKGVLYSHRSNFLHSMAVNTKDAMGVDACASFLPVVPMFHANAWGIPFAAAAAGAKLVLNGPCHDPEPLQKYIIDEGVTATAAVPTIWSGMLAYLQSTGKDLGKLKDVVIGGSAVPRSMVESFKKDFGITVVHAWGMTETNPLGSMSRPTMEIMAMDEETQLDMNCKQGRAVPGVEMRIVNDNGEKLPRDGIAFGHLQVRGPWVVKSYFKDEGGSPLDAEGWFNTGDVATIDTYGYMQITDRSKDVIKSGGEWISSIELENAAVGHPDIVEAAVIGVYHPKWEERPLMVTVMQEGKSISNDEMCAYLEGKVAKWWMPEDTIAVDEIPHTATGKISKLLLREKLKDYKLPGT